MNFTRREFLKAAGLAGMGSLALSAVWRRLLPAAEAAPANAGVKPLTDQLARVKVFEIDEPRLLDEFGNVRDDYLHGVLSRLLRVMTGTAQPEDAWHHFFAKSDVIGIKFDPIAALELRTSAPLARLLVESLLDADFEVERIMLIDGPIQPTEYSTRVPPFGYEEQPVKAGGRETHFLRALSQVTALLNVPFLKDHRALGLSCGMANMALGLVSNPGEFLQDGGDPGVAELCACDQIRKKHRLTLVNAIRGIYDGGPRLAEGKAWNQASIVAATDFVAADRVALNLLDNARFGRGLRSLADAGRPTKYLDRAARLGLGEADISRIELRQVSL